MIDKNRIITRDDLVAEHVQEYLTVIPDAKAEHVAEHVLINMFEQVDQELLTAINEATFETLRQLGEI